MIHRPTFMQSLQYPPSHYKFPVSIQFSCFPIKSNCPPQATPLLHAILAAAAFYVSPDVLSSPAYFPVGAPSSSTIHPLIDFNTDKVRKSNPMSSFHLTGKSTTPPEVLSGDITRFQVWHRRKAFEGIAEHFDRGEKLMQCFQSRFYSI